MERGYTDVVKLLLSRDDLAPMEDAGVAVLLQAAIDFGDADILRLILNYPRFQSISSDYLNYESASEDIVQLILSNTDEEDEY